MRNRKRKKIKNPTLDLHGVKHSEASVLVEEFILLNKMPVHIITGHSEEMKTIVRNLLEKHDFPYLAGNFGVILVY